MTGPQVVVSAEMAIMDTTANTLVPRAHMVPTVQRNVTAIEMQNVTQLLVSADVRLGGQDQNASRLAPLDSMVSTVCSCVTV